MLASRPDGNPRKRQQKQILLRLEARVARRFLAPIQKNPDPVSEFRKGAEFRGSHDAGGHHR